MPEPKFESYDDVMWGTMEPDCYGGETYDELVPRWNCHAADDKGGPDTSDVVSLAAKTFPPGTTIVISVPVCPECGESSDCALEHSTGKMNNCSCGFDWVEWARNEYS